MLRGLEILIGLYYFVMGVDGFLNKLPRPAPSPRALLFLQSLQETRYILLIVKIVEITVGLFWVFDFHTGLAWLLFTPIWLNIILYHFILNKKEFITPTLIFLAHAILAYKNKDYLLSVLLN